jgi:hypothetical protein
MFPKITKGSWKESNDKLQQKLLTLEVLLYQKVKEEELLVRLQNKLGKTKNELNKVISKL